ncbi:hypothetical protein K443DRAFT_98342 [Laccaria amethystina LaAM-08-1]|uniref:Unplaced genomic scaffold K443scaffold_69, whole genome shotgun sequence n=1 Tax=Laccaria amethystina LaAM-08-1 TaxID=1095629 RepID=A0A0C9XVF3_9AGAR|nr:hypothetical protein K443DRAFT_98342 [Laccaria amethystina LaAM-08-1]
MHCVASFQVKNNGNINVFVNLKKPSLAVTVRPGEISPPFTSPGTYIIRSEREHLPFPPPEIAVIFSPGKLFEAKSINNPSLNVEILAKLDFPNGDLISSLSPVESAHYF